MKKLKFLFIFQTLGLCSSNGNLVLKPDSVPLTKLDDALYFKPQGHMLGEDDCTYGPSLWCRDEQTAKRCNVSLVEEKIILSQIQLTMRKLVNRGL